MVKETNYTLKELLSTIEAIDKIVKNQKCKHKAVRKKFSSSKYSRVESCFYFTFKSDW